LLLRRVLCIRGNSRDEVAVKTSSAGQVSQKWMESRALGGVSKLALCAGLSLLFVAGAAPAQAQFGWFGAGAGPAEPGYTARYYARGPAAHRHAVRHTRGKTGKAAKEANDEPAKPVVGPLIIAISINRQHLTVYDGERPVASTIISTGVKGHETPFGVFSVLQKELLHHSNLYSNAPMPHMQRITWSGVALHAGMVTGRPASHGCIRLPGFRNPLVRHDQGWGAGDHLAQRGRADRILESAPIHNAGDAVPCRRCDAKRDGSHGRCAGPRGSLGCRRQAAGCRTDRFPRQDADSAHGERRSPRQGSAASGCLSGALGLCRNGADA